MCKYELMGDGVYVFKRWKGRNELVTVQWGGGGRGGGEQTVELNMEPRL